MMISYAEALLAACLLDLLFGDPRWLPHPVQAIGKLAALLEVWTRSLFDSDKTAGVITAVLVLAATGLTCTVILAVLAVMGKAVLAMGTVLMLYTTFAIRDLLKHARAVYQALTGPARNSLDTSRQKVAMLVGRDTTHLDGAGIIRACVESVAENMADGILAPLFWSLAGAGLTTLAGPARWAAPAAAIAAMLYKAANTMDSMFGYKNGRYRNFGWFPARFDDLVNLVPARLAGLFLVLAAVLLRSHPGRAWQTLRRDHANHTSPNAGYPEAAMAGALGLRLGGGGWYFGTYQKKPFLGDPLIPPTPGHIIQANRLVLTGSLAAILFSAAFSLVFFH